MSTTPNTHMARRLTASFIALIIIMGGTAVITLSSLGTAPISSPPLALSLVGGLSFGGWFFVFNFALFAMQPLIMRGSFPKTGWLQLPAMTLASFTLDMWMYLLDWIRTDNYLGQLGIVAIGVVIVGFGISILAASNTIYLPGEGFISMVSTMRGLPFPRVKLFFDLSCVAFAFVIAYFFAGSLEAVREATLITSLTAAYVVRFCLPLSKKIAYPAGQASA